MLLKTSDFKTIKKHLSKIYIPAKDSHKGKNGKVLIIGGSNLFHAASIWSAETASHIVDIVHYSSTLENNQIVLSLKEKFLNGIVVRKQDLIHYIQEDDCVLIGPGMIRCDKKILKKDLMFKDITSLEEEGDYTRFLTRYLIENYPEKKFVFDAGALQMMDPEWLLKLKTKPILTPHLIEFDNLFGVKLRSDSKNKEKTVLRIAKKYNCVILLKSVDDIISDGKRAYTIKGGNAGLAKGGSGDVLAGLSCSFYAKNNVLLSALTSSILLKITAEKLFLTKGYWYNISDIIDKFPEILKSLRLYK